MQRVCTITKIQKILLYRGNVEPIGQQHISVINLRFQCSERCELSLVLKSHVCVRMEQEAWWLQQKNFFLVQSKKIRIIVRF